MSYRENKARAIFTNTQPTMTDQSQGHETDINVIVGKYGIGQTAPGANGEPTYADWTNMPTDLREMIETARRLEDHRAALPDALRDMPIEEILSLTDDSLTNILTPPATTPAATPNNPAGETK